MDVLDRQIANLLCQNGRRSNVDIARELGVSEGTIRKRVDRLLESGALRIVGLVDPESIGFRVHVMIFVTAELARVESIARRLCDAPEVLSVYLVTGEYHVVVEAVFESDERLMSFLTEQLATMPGIVATKTGHVPQIVKSRYEWALPQPPPPRILIVDDDPDFVEFTRFILEQEGYTVRSASSGRAALATMQTASPDLVILDIMMDGIFDGWDAGRRMRQDAQLRDVPILVVSSITASDYLNQFPTDDDNLIDNFMSKPVDPQALRGEVKRLLGRRQGWGIGRLR